MRIFGLVCVAFSALFMAGPGICADPRAGSPIGFVGGCEIDLNADGNTDYALLVNSGRSYELIVILRSREGSKSFIVNRSDSLRHLTCRSGRRITQTAAYPGKKPGRTYSTNGAYLTLLQPESSEVAYYWSNGDFKEVWISD